MPRNGHDDWRNPGLYHAYLVAVAKEYLAQPLYIRIGEDGVQKALTRALEKRDQFRGDCPDHFRGWLRVILLRILTDDLKALPREIQLEGDRESSQRKIADALEAADTPPPKKAEKKEDLLRLEAAMRRLPERQREAIRLWYLDGMDMAQIRARMNLSIDALGGLLRHAMKNLRDYFDESE